MPTYVPHYKNDIFVSYAQVDDEPLMGADHGWVTTLINGLKILLRQKLGRADAYSLWMAQELHGHQTISPAVAEQLNSSATFLLILSPAYLASPWCLHELRTFLSIVGIDAGRIFLVERDEVPRPNELNDLLGYPFWLTSETGKSRTLGIPKPTVEELEYYQKLNDLAHQLADQLKGLKTEIERSPRVLTPAVTNPRLVAITPPIVLVSSPPSSPTLFLAEVAADLEGYRLEVKRYFEQQGFQILPNRRYPFAQIQQYLEQDLKQSQWFVQLLSDKIDNGYSQFQYEQAQAAQLPIFQWRDPTLALETVTEANHRALLEASTVIATSLVEFQIYLRQQFKATSEPLGPKPVGDVLVFINAAPEDMSLAYELKTWLDAQGIGYSLPLEVSATTKAAEIRQYLEQNLLYSDAVLILYDNTSVVWVSEQLLYCRRLQGRREQPLKVIAVYYKPSPQKPPLQIKFPNLRVLECTTPHSFTCLPIFLQTLQI